MHNAGKFDAAYLKDPPEQIVFVPAEGEKRLGTAQQSFYDNYDFFNNTELWSSRNQSNYLFHADLAFHDKENNVKGLTTAELVRISGSTQTLLSVHYYDEYNRLIQSVSETTFGDVDIISTKYLFSGEVKKTVTHHRYGSRAAHSLEERYIYDHAGRLIETKLSADGAPLVSTAKNAYNEIDELVRKGLHSDNLGIFAETVDYSYNLRGWLTKINDPYNPGERLFSLLLRYAYENPPIGTAQYNGNIAAAMWKTAGSDRVWYSYEYDPLNRLSAANYSDAAKFNTQYTYDLNGNITRLTRSGYTAGSFAQIDDLEYLYEGNRLKTVNDLSRMREGFTDNAFMSDTDDYSYDANGNLTSDLNKSISDIEYNFVNLPEKISMQNGNRIEYSYTTTGAKLAKQVYEQDRLQSSTQYSGAFVYEDDAVSYLLFSEGRLLYEGNRTWKFEYHLKDHLGNVRVAFEPENNNKITQRNDYYPFGMQIQYNPFELPGTNKYKYNGKEMQDEFGLDWLDYGARFYDAEIGRWHVVDPMSESYYSQSPYHFSGNNPILFVDDNGMNYDGYTVDEKGNIERVDDTGGEDYDVLYRKDEYERAKIFGVTNEQGNPEPLNQSEKIHDTEILPKLEKGKKVAQEYADGRNKRTGIERKAYAGESSADDMLKIFKFAADNSNAEWNIQYGKVDGAIKYGIGTYGWDDLSPGLFSNDEKITGIHSHPKPISKKDEIDSMWGDRQNSKSRKVGYVYMAKTSRMYHVKDGKSAFIRKISSYKRFINMK